MSTGLKNLMISFISKLSNFFIGTYYCSISIFFCLFLVFCLFCFLFCFVCLLIQITCFNWAREKNNTLELEREICALNHYDMLTSLSTCYCFSIRYRTMAVTTRLTWSEEKSLQKMLGNVSLRLLYKSSVHENKTSSILDKCTCQGPTVTIIYIRNTTVGIFMLGPYSKTYDHLKRPNPSFYFSYQRNIATEMRTAVLETETKIASGQLVFYSSGQEVLSVCLNDTKLSINDSLSKALGVYNRSDISYLECEVFRVEGMLNEIILHSDSSLSLSLWVIIELQEQGKTRGTSDFTPSDFSFMNFRMKPRKHNGREVLLRQYRQL